MRVLVACEYSGRVREAFIDQGHEAVSCDLLPSDLPGSHHIGDALEFAWSQKWDMMIAFPPCTDLAVSGARWWPEKVADGRQAAALRFVQALMDLPIHRIAIENPVGKISTSIRKPDQIVQPWMFGHGETKATCLWLKNLPKLTPTEVVSGRAPVIHKMPGGRNQAHKRSLTYYGIANAMAAQWGAV